MGQWGSQWSALGSGSNEIGHPYDVGWSYIYALPVAIFTRIGWLLHPGSVPGFVSVEFYSLFFVYLLHAVPVVSVHASRVLPRVYVCASLSFAQSPVHVIFSLMS